MNRYTVPPFSGSSFQKNQARLKDGETPCAICGRAVAFPFQHSAVVVGGGDWARTPEEVQDESDSGYMGEWGIGPDCHRKYIVKELLYCWVAQALNVLVPKAKGEGYLKVPYGHHHNKELSDIAHKAHCDVFGLDGALEFVCGGQVFHGGEEKRAEFAAIVIPELEKHYGWSAREIDRDEYWKLNPVTPQDGPD